METSPYLKATPWAWSAARTVLQASADGGAALQGRQCGRGGSAAGTGTIVHMDGERRYFVHFTIRAHMSGQLTVKTGWKVDGMVWRAKIVRPMACRC
jgi:hypothetical protein